MKGIKYEVQEDRWTPRILNIRNRLIKLLSFKYMVLFMKKKGWLREWICEPKKAGTRSHRKLFQNLKNNGVWLEITTDDDFFFFLFLSRNTYNC